MTTELNRLRTSLGETLGRSFDLPEVPRDLPKETEVLLAWLGGAGASRPPRDRMREAVSAFWQSRKLGTLGEARLVCFGSIERFTETHPPLIEDERWFLHLLAEVDDFSAEPRAFRRCYRGLLDAYFLYDPDSRSAGSVGQVCHKKLQRYLQARLEQIRVEGTQLEWVDVIGAHRNLLTDEPVTRYGAAMLRGDSGEFDEARTGLGIDENSWVMRRLVLAQVKAATERPDQEFVKFIDPLLHVLNQHSLQKEEGLALLLDRYQSMPAQPEHARLRDASIEAWGNPTLVMNDAKWGRVRPESRRMVRNWLNLNLIRLFFSVLSEDRSADRRRVRFWEKYHTRIDTIYVAFGPRALRDRTADMRRLREQLGAHSLTLTHQGSAANNAFIMCMGDRVVVEFGMTGNACFVFRRGELPVDLRGEVAGDWRGLKHQDHEHRLLHIDRSYETWEHDFAGVMRKIGISPGEEPVRAAPSWQETPAPIVQPTAPATTGARPEVFSWPALRRFVEAQGLRIEDLTNRGGRLWVVGAPEHGPLTNQLTGWGFRWAKHRDAWYREM